MRRPSRQGSQSVVSVSENGRRTANRGPTPSSVPSRCDRIQPARVSLCPLNPTTGDHCQCESQPIPGFSGFFTTRLSHPYFARSTESIV